MINPGMTNPKFIMEGTPSLPAGRGTGGGYPFVIPAYLSPRRKPGRDPVPNTALRKCYFLLLIKYTPTNITPMHPTCNKVILSPSSSPHPMAKIGMM
jgi:hypothetical protein